MTWLRPAGRLCRLLGILALAGMLTRPAARSAEPERHPADATAPPPFEQFLVVPLRVHLLSSKTIDEVDCRLTDADVARILKKVNAIWHKAGIHWGLESLRREPAARQDEFGRLLELFGKVRLDRFRMLIPRDDDSRRFDGLHVYYLHRFPVNGVWLGDDFALVQDSSRLREVEGGIDEPIPRVTAHELGHALGLAHRQDRTNLLASGTTGTLLNTQEVATARRTAERLKGSLPISALRSQARTAREQGEVERARRLWTWMAEIPGDGAGEARRELKVLGEGAGEKQATGSR